MAFLDLKALWETLVVGRWECATAEGILPSPPALNLKGSEARLDVCLNEINRLGPGILYFFFSFLFENMPYIKGLKVKGRVSQ